MDIEETKKEIKKLLCQIATDLREEPCNEIWTIDIKKRLTLLGNKKGYGVAAGGMDEVEHEKWLYDLTWWSYKNERHLNNMTSINLATEIKWKETKGVLRVLEYENSFLRLVYAKTKLKLFVFMAPDKDKYEEISNQLEKLANMCEDRDGDKYLLYCTVWIEGRGYTFMYKTFTTQKEKSNIEKIKKSLNQVAIDLKGKSGRKIWTRTIKKKLTSLGQENGYAVADEDIKKDFREWLYDLVWWKYKDNHFNNMISIDLAVESEWTPSWKEINGEKRGAEYEKDFLKLVYAKAKLKLFIFGAYNKEDLEKRLKQFKRLANMCEDRNGDKYLFSCALGTKKEGFTFVHEPFTAESR